MLTCCLRKGVTVAVEVSKSILRLVRPILIHVEGQRSALFWNPAAKQYEAKVALWRRADYISPADTLYESHGSQ